MIDRDSRVVGYVAIGPRHMGVLCDGDSCVVAGSEEQMRHYIVSASSGLKDYTISKARYGHIRQALALGAAYSFDAESFERFRPLAILDRHDLSHVSTQIDAWPESGSGIPLIRVQYD